MATTDNKFKKVRVFSIARDLNVTVETIIEHIKAAGFHDALAGSGLNASIVSEEAYLDLLDAYATDKKVASRVKELRAARQAEHESVAVPEAVVPSKPQPEPEPVPPVIEVPVAEEESPAPAEALKAVEEQQLPSSEEPAPVEAEAPVEEPAPVAVEVEEPVAETALALEPAQPEAPPKAVPTPVEVVAEEPVTEEIEPEPIEQEPQEVASEVSATLEEVLEVSEEEEQEIAPSVITADRYKLQGTKVLGTLDLSTLEDLRPSRTRKKRKRKRKGESEADESPVALPVADRKPEKTEKPATGRKAPAKDTQEQAPASSSRKGKRKPKVDEEAVEQTLAETLREMEKGAARTRQRRRRTQRQTRAEERERELQEQQEEDMVLRVTEFVSTGELANLMHVPVNEVIGSLFSAGVIVSINQRLDADTIQFVADEFGYQVEFITEFGTDDIEIEEDLPEDLVTRAPVVTVMGHVDHGKTSLLDRIRKANVVSGESGGITQHIGAYRVNLPNGRAITFLDTPGHEAFTAMRARGAQVTDVVILVVAANDAVMPQTIEAINHARAADVPIVVAINKIDLHDANIQRVMVQLADQNVLIEQYGGKVQCAEVSAKAGIGIEDLLDKVLLEADLLDLKANPDREANGVVIESRLDKGRGNVATVLVQNGTLKVGDPFVAGILSGRVRAMFDERDQRIDEAGPASPALVLGISGAPSVGDQFVVMKEESEARDIAQRRQQIHREQKLRQHKHVRLEDIGRQMALGNFSELNLIIKADVGGSVEALSDALLKISNEEVAVNIIHSGVGAISESDVMLASASNAVIIGFQVRPTAGARTLAEREEIDIHTYSIIYDAIETIHDALEGMLRPEKSEKIIGVAEVRDLFKVPKVGTIAGCYVTEGRIHRNDTIHLVREGVVIYAGKISSLKRFKDDAREVQSGYECGISIENFNDLKVGDAIESYEIIETKRKLEV